MNSLRLEIASPHILSRLLKAPMKFYEKVSICCMTKIETETLLQYLSTQTHLRFVRLHSIYSELTYYQRLARAIVELINWIEHVYRQDFSPAFRVVYRLYPNSVFLISSAPLSQKSSPKSKLLTLKTLNAKIIDEGVSHIELHTIKRLELSPPRPKSKCFAYRILKSMHFLQSLTLSARHTESLQKTINAVRTNTTIRSLELYRCKLSALNLSGNTTLTHLYLQDIKVSVLEESGFALPLSLVSLSLKNANWKGNIHTRHFESLTSLEVLAIGSSFLNSENFNTLITSCIRNTPSLHTLKCKFPKLSSRQTSRMYAAILHQPRRWINLTLRPNPNFMLLNRILVACINLQSLKARKIIACFIHDSFKLSFPESLLRLDFDFNSYINEQKNIVEGYVSTCHKRLACHPNILSCHFSQIVYGSPIHTLSYETPEYVERNVHNHRLRQHTLVLLLCNPNHLFPNPSTPSVYSN